MDIKEKNDIFIDNANLQGRMSVFHDKLRKHNSDFGHVTYTEAIKILEKHNDEFDYKVFWGCDLQTEHERYLTEKIFKRPVFVTDYPKEIKAFYMKLNPDGKTVAAVDCLVPGIGAAVFHRLCRRARSLRVLARKSAGRLPVIWL